MASLQRYSSHSQTYWRLVESFRRPGGKPTVRVLMHLGKAEELFYRLQLGLAPSVRRIPGRTRSWSCMRSLRC